MSITDYPITLVISKVWYSVDIELKTIIVCSLESIQKWGPVTVLEHMGPSLEIYYIKCIYDIAQTLTAFFPHDFCCTVPMTPL